MKTYLISFVMILGSLPMLAQPISTRSDTPAEQVWVWSIQGQASYQDKDMGMARPVIEGQQLTSKAKIWVSDQGKVYLLCKGSFKDFGPGIHNLADWVKSISSASGMTGSADQIVPKPDPDVDPFQPIPESGFGQRMNIPLTSGNRSGSDGSGFSQGVTPPTTSGNRSGNDGSGFGQGVTPPTTSGNRSGNDGSGFGQGVTPPTTSGNRSGNDGSGFGQGVTPPTTSGNRSGNDGSGFGQGVTPPTTSGNRSGNDGSGFGQGVTPPTTSGNRSGNDGSGFGDGLTPPTDVGTKDKENRQLGGSGFGDGLTPPSDLGTRDRESRQSGGSGFGDGLTPPPDLGTRDRDSRQSGGSGGVEIGQKMVFIGAFGGKVTPGPVYYRWTHPGKYTCEFKVGKPGSSSVPFFQTNTHVGGLALDLRDYDLTVGETYVASVSVPDKTEAGKAQVTFQIADVSEQEALLTAAEQNDLYASAGLGHQHLLKAMTLEKENFQAAASAHYQKAIEVNPLSDLVRAMVYTFRKKYHLD